MWSGYYKKSNGKIFKLGQQDDLCLYSNNIVELVIPDGCKKVWADMKSVTELNKVDYLKLYI